MTLKTVPDELIGRLTSFSIIFKLSKEPGTQGDSVVVAPGDVAIIVGVVLARKKWLTAYVEPTIWYRVQTSHGSGWFDSEATAWRLQPNE